MVCVPAPLPALTLSVAFLNPVAVGLNTTLIVQVAFAATEVPQVLVCEKGWGLVLESVMLVMGSATLPVFVTVAACAALFVPCAWLPNATTVGATVYGGATPDPVSATVCVPAPPPALTLSVPFFNPGEVGLNTTLIVQVALTATDVPQVLVCANEWALVPESVMLVIGSATAPVFVTVVDMGALATFVVSLPNAKDAGDSA